MPAPDKFRPFKDSCRPKSEDPQLNIDTLTADELLDLLANAEIANEQSDSGDAGSS
jgi:hypothetical protein